MAVVFTDGFDSGAGGDTLIRWWRGGGLNTSLGGRFGGTCGQIGTITFSSCPITVSGTRICGGFWFKTDDYGAGGVFLRFYDAGIDQFGGIGCNGSGLLYISAWHTSPAQTYVAPSTIVDDDVWHWVEFDINFANSGHAYMYIDGVSVINQPTLDLLNTGTVAIERVALDGNGVDAAYIDDFILWDDTSGGLQFSDFPVGPQRCETLRPNSDISTQWARSTGTTNFGVIDDATHTVTDYVTSQTPGHEDRYGYPSISRTPLSITAVTVATSGRNEGAGITTARTLMHSGATTVEGATTNLDGTTRVFEIVRDLDPNTGSAWTTSGVAALEAGIELVS